MRPGWGQGMEKLWIRNTWEGLHRQAKASAILLLMGLMGGAGVASAQSVPAMLWYAVTLDFNGPEASESGTPNPFLYYRLMEEFTTPDVQDFTADWRSEVAWRHGALRLIPDEAPD